MDQLFDKLEETVSYIKRINDFYPEVGIVLGTGLGNLSNEIEVIAEIPYKDIPHFPVTSVESHKGKLILGYLSGKRVVALSGRFHYYEGHDMTVVTFPIRVLKLLGVQFAILSNAVGSTNELMNVGDLVFIKDHINFHVENPLRGKNDERLGVRFPEMRNAYSTRLNTLALSICKELNIRAHEGVYFGLPGPNLETPAEYNMIHILGGDVVGMSLVPEVITARHMNLEVLGISAVTNKCFPIDQIQEATLETVIKAAEQAEHDMTLVVKNIIDTSL